MDLLHWDDSFETGIPAADHEHGKLIDLINTLYDRWQREGGSDYSKLFDPIRDVLASHFDFEDRLVRGSDFAGYAPHAGDHERVLADLRRLRARADEPGFDLRADLAPYLQEWLVNHIRHYDAPLYRALSPDD